ncbi:2-oxo acid dehydrogenase subunit E2 [Streptomyces coffeae]|uniref:Dihydrolipoamide acetyltransferase component of pyruvate dehydrogenase complex n=1 Tax=Streptomyces coffeae TaxID=621382 RepID=A0ABS1NL08_9ACTN|nr:2-oxo acid dehydrogenase subunit E2 [Streptomyces coffeae]MBL1100570.1 2-oxo acid dehydrogenase subunit E2 [Streptomyces coffeae]
MAEIAIPKLNNNDSSYLLLEWLFDDGDEVPADAAVAVLETSKATEDLIAPSAGVLERLVPAGTECACGELIGRLLPAASESAPAEPAVARAATAESTAIPGTATDAGKVSVLVTAPARALMDRLGLDEAALAELDTKVVKRADIERLAGTRGASAVRDAATPSHREPAPDPEPGLHELSPNQRAVWTVVSESQRTVPAAFTVVHVDMGPVEASAARLGAMAGAPEYVIAAMARLRTDFPLFFAAPAHPGTVRPADSAHIAVTIDVGKGLFTPVVRDAERLTVADIADVMMEFRIKAIRDGFRGSDLSGGTALLALNNDAEVVVATPLVFPGHTCAASLADTRDELVADESGGVRVRRVAALGLAYDHRVINGRDSVRFLHALRQRLEQPEGLTATPSDAG